MTPATTPATTSAATLWQPAARPLPVRLRPVAGETVVSFCFRLAAANHLVHPTSVLRALGRPRQLPTRSVLADRDVVLNAAATARLETMVGIPAARLRWALPALARSRAGGLRTDIPAWRLEHHPALRRPCERCAARRPGPGPVVVHPLEFPRLCGRHRRWIDTGPEQPGQLDLTAAPEIVAAHRRYARLRRRGGDPAWIAEQLRLAIGMARTWAVGSDRTSPRLHARWAARAAALHARTDAGTDGGLDAGVGPGRPTRVLVFPEAVAIAELLCDPDWRRHVAMVTSGLHLSWFYRRMALRLGEPAAVGDMLQNLRYSRPDPLQSWIAAHRRLHAPTRTWFWQRVGSLPTPFPPVDQFR